METGEPSDPEMMKALEAYYLIMYAVEATNRGLTPMFYGKGLKQMLDEL